MCTEVVYLLRCLRLTYLVPRETAAISARSVYTIQPCMTSCHFAQSHVGWAHACLAVTCHLHFWQTDRDLFRCYCGNTGWNGYRNKSTQKVGPGKENSPAAPAGTRTRDLSIMSPACVLQYDLYYLQLEYLFIRHMCCITTCITCNWNIYSSGICIALQLLLFARGISSHPAYVMCCTVCIT